MSTKLKQPAGWRAATTKTFGGFSQQKENIGSFTISADTGLEKNLNEEPKIDFVSGNEKTASHRIK